MRIHLCRINRWSKIKTENHQIKKLLFGMHTHCVQTNNFNARPRLWQRNTSQMGDWHTRDPMIYVKFRHQFLYHTGFVAPSKAVCTLALRLVPPCKTCFTKITRSEKVRHANSQTHTGRNFWGIPFFTHIGKLLS